MAVNDPVTQALKDAFKARMQPGAVICRAAVEAVLHRYNHNRKAIKRDFSQLVEAIEAEAYELYLSHEKRCAAEAFREVLMPKLSDTPTPEDVVAMFEDNFVPFDRFFLGLAQGRKARAGKAFEHIIRVLFGELGYPYTAQAIINGQPDFLLPSEEHFRKMPMDCIIFTVKRTLRERWRQITTEGTKGLHFFLATIDEKIASRDLPDMLNHRIYVVVPKRIQEAKYKDANNVVSFETFFAQHLDPAMERWAANGVVGGSNGEPDGTLFA